MAKPGAPLLSKSTRFLVIDDLPTIRRLVHQQLSEIGFNEILEAGDGEEAWKILSKDDAQANKIQFVIADWNMPKLSGLELLNRTREVSWGKELPFILLTSENSREQVSAAVIAGVSQYIIKPFSRQVLMIKLVEAWKKHNP